MKTKAHHGILLIHGLMSSPVGMSSLEEYFQKQGYITLAILLPGHGTTPKDLLDVTYENWLDACRSGIKKLREEVEHVTVMAFSAGTALSIYLSLTENSIDSLVLFSPALALKNALIPFVPFLYTFRNCSSFVNWSILKEENDYAKYQSLPINAVYQISQLIKKIRHIQDPLAIPLYIISSVDDETISHQQAIHFFIKQHHPLNRGIIYANETDHFNIKKQNLPTSLQIRKSNYSKENILDFSHTALTIASSHPHYGKNGDYADFGHYTKKKLQKFKSKNFPLYYGATSRKNLKKYYLQRLSYNPDFDYLVNDINNFLKMVCL